MSNSATLGKNSARRWGGLLFAVVFVALVAQNSFAQKTDNDLGQLIGGQWCGTQVIYDLKHPATQASGAEASCPGQGDCDIPSIRDSWIPDPSDPVVVINVYFHVFRNDDGSNAACTAGDVATAVDAMNLAYAPLRIQFEYQMRFVNDSRYRTCSSDGEFFAMKAAYALAPDSQCNIYVVSVNVGGEVFSYGTFPWDGDALSSQGGIVMNNTQMPPYNDKTISHEMGHNLGLWHTHHGVSEVNACSACYELASGANGDVTGDFCSDTDPTPTNFNCAPPGGNDCQGTPWGATMPQNFMGYGPAFCRDEFSDQQSGRMHCWTNEILTSWLNNVRIQADTVLGTPPFAVQFTGVTPKTVSQWTWDFGDGQTSNQANPAHVYNDPGYFDVSVSIQATDGTYNTVNKGYIWVEADSMIVENSKLQLGQSVGVNVYARNYVPVRIIDIPFAYDGPCNLVLDSITRTGLRTEYIDFGDKISGSSFSKIATYRIRSISTPQLPPGSGPIATLWFTAGDLPPGATNDIRFIEYGSVTHYEPKFFVDVGEYNPVTVDATLDGCVAGDVNGDGSGGDPTDLSALVDYMFGGSTAPLNEDGADCNNDGLVDPVDLSYLVDFLFGGGIAPVC